MSEGGIFSGMEGYDALDHLDEKQTAEGLIVTRTCEMCQREIGTLIPWVELFLVANQINPAQRIPSLSAWKADRRKIYPEVVCRYDQTPLLYPFTPQKARSLVDQALSNTGVASAEQRNIIGQLIAQSRQVPRQG
jgi:hypothetical protein